MEAPIKKAIHVFNEMLKTLEENSKDNKVTIPDVKFFIERWKKEMDAKSLIEKEHALLNKTRGNGYDLGINGLQLQPSENDEYINNLLY